MVKALAIAALFGSLWATAVDGKSGSMEHSFYDFTVKNIDGKDVALSKYKGDVCLVVNVASY